MSSTIRSTMAQALVRFLSVQYTERDGTRQPFFGGMFGIFGHGNVAGVGQALDQMRRGLRYYQCRNEQPMVHTAVSLLLPTFRKTNDEESLRKAFTGVFREGAANPGAQFRFQPEWDMGHDREIAWIYRRSPAPGDIRNNEENLFDSGLYVGIGGTAAALVLQVLKVIEPDLLAAYSSNLFGITCVALVKIRHVRPYKRQLILEGQIEASTIREVNEPSVASARSSAAL